jgi:hypothetical protein
MFHTPAFNSMPITSSPTMARPVQAAAEKGVHVPTGRSHGAQSEHHASDPSMHWVSSVLTQTTFNFALCGVEVAL